jgi:hypothetical protein
MITYSWLLNEKTCLWKALIAYPQDSKQYKWNKATTFCLETVI